MSETAQQIPSSPGSTDSTGASSAGPALSVLEEVLIEVHKEYTEIKDGEALFNALEGRLRAVYNNPPVEECNLCLHGVSFSADELRFIMFAPTLSQVKFYAPFVSSENTQGGSNARSRSIFLTLIYLLHR